MEKLINSTKRLFANQHFKYGSSFLTFMVVAWFGLVEFAKIRYDLKEHQGKAAELDEKAKEFGLERKPRKSVEELYLEVVEKQNLDEWKNIRGPRPGENSRSIQEQQRSQQD
uniref:Cytochrome c oxidase assembly protein COX16 homolog, mitochondrial n=1 Tax=Phallusia mammillata TaxID=59560 RepID=A0A6F9DAQ0_9ASCI|nr:cytochrome c oxidase assembly protein COX16 homolog, mitochondrial-like [Phallusia mammillata]